MLPWVLFLSHLFLPRIYEPPRVEDSFVGLVKNDNLVNIELQENCSSVLRFIGSSGRGPEAVEIKELRNRGTEEPGDGEREARALPNLT